MPCALAGGLASELRLVALARVLTAGPDFLRHDRSNRLRHYFAAGFPDVTPADDAEAIRRAALYRALFPTRLGAAA